jgi:hypothetical protein
VTKDRPMFWAICIVALLLYIYAIWRVFHTWAGRSQNNLLAWFIFLGLAGGLFFGLVFQAATHGRYIH